MSKRQKLTKKKSNNNFRKNMGTHPKNRRPIPMRGGFRL